MGIVWQARQISLNRPVALKMIRGGQFALSADVARFHVEAEAAARLGHPNIVPIYEYGEHAGWHYFTMEVVAGGRSLASELTSGPCTPRRAAALISTVARAVHYAHQHGVLHRDIKPANILLDAAGEPHLADFGLARIEEANLKITQSDKLIGTPHYMSPEQAAGREITTAADVYSLGAVLYEMLTGRPPFQADSIPEILRIVVEKDPKPPRQRNKAVDATSRRYASSASKRVHAVATHPPMPWPVISIAGWRTCRSRPARLDRHTPDEMGAPQAGRRSPDNRPRHHRRSRRGRRGLGVAGGT